MMSPVDSERAFSTPESWFGQAALFGDSRPFRRITLTPNFSVQLVDELGIIDKSAVTT